MLNRCAIFTKKKKLTDVLNILKLFSKIFGANSAPNNSLGPAVFRYGTYIRFRSIRAHKVHNRFPLKTA